MNRILLQVPFLKGVYKLSICVYFFFLKIIIIEELILEIVKTLKLCNYFHFQFHVIHCFNFKIFELN